MVLCLHVILYLLCHTSYANKMDQSRETSETASIHQATFLDGGKFFSSPVRLQDQSAVGRLDYAVDSIVEQLEDGTYRSVGQPEEPRKTYRSCEFCARRKRRCDGDGVNRCRSV